MPRLCRCGAIVDKHCPTCRPQTHARTTAQRGYDNKWRQVRERYITDNPLCEDCIDSGNVKPAEQVHHMITIEEAPHLRLDPANLRSLCVACHAARHTTGR